jgi:hypothetical protein
MTGRTEERSVTLDTQDRDGIAKLREALKTGGYEPKRMRPMLRADSDNLTPRPTDIPIVTRLLPQGRTAGRAPAPVPPRAMEFKYGGSVVA